MQNNEQTLVYIDAFKTETSIRSEIIINNSVHKFRIPVLNIIFTSKALAIRKAIQLINKIPNLYFNILTDSLSTRTSIQNTKKKK
jgi:hypothetical protein